jgi:peptide/nickel transport system permease protein
MIQSTPHSLASGRPRLFTSVRAWLLTHPLLAYAFRRFIAYVITLWGSFTVTFFLFRLMPGNPIEAYIQSLREKQLYTTHASKDMVVYYNKIFDLDGNLFQQYYHYMYQLIVQRDLGPSLLSFPTPSQDLIAQSLPWTIGLLGLATLISPGYLALSLAR